MAKHYHLQNIRTLLTEGFTAETLRRFCYDTPDFRPVYDELAQDTGKARIIDQLLEYAERQVLFETLLDLVKTLNPSKYAEHQPYLAGASAPVEVREPASYPTPYLPPADKQASAAPTPISPHREPQIINPNRLSLPPAAEAILKQMFGGYRRLIIEREFGGGFSGGRVLLLRPIRDEDRPELPAVIKIASVSLIAQERQAYRDFIENRLPNAIGLRDTPLLPGNSEWDALRYPLMGSGTFAFQSLRDYCRTASLEDIRFVFENRLLKAIESLLQFNRVRAAFSLQTSYDPLLPLNLLVQPDPAPAGTSPALLTPQTIGVPLKQGDYVRLAGFVVTKVDLVAGTVTLNVPTGPDDLPASYSLRLKSVAGLASYQAGQLIKPIVGRVLETRQERLEAEARRALGAGFHPAQEQLTLPDGTRLPNPLLKLPHLLSQMPHVRVGTIHGDLNLENVLVDPAIREINLIDFAAAREDHVLHDFLRLETEVIVKLIPELLAQANLGAGVICPFYERLHQFMLQPAPSTPPELPHPSLVKPLTLLTLIRTAARRYFFNPDDWTEYYQALVLYLLGALKFASLDQLAEAPAPLPKQVAFLGAGVIGRMMWESPVHSTFVPYPSQWNIPDQQVSLTGSHNQAVTVGGKLSISGSIIQSQSNTDSIKPTDVLNSSQDPPKEKIFDIAILKELLTAALDDNDLTDLCQNHFPKVYNEFSEGMKNSTRRRLLLDYCGRHNQLQQLVCHIKRLNSEKYQEYFLYLVKPVLDKFESKKETDHIQAARILGQLGELGAISILELQLLGQQNPNIRYWLAIAIGEIGGNEAKEALNRIEQKLTNQSTDSYTLLGIEDAKKLAEAKNDR